MTTINGLPLPGESETLTRTFTPEDVAAFARLSGDDNPLHLDAAYAATTRFGRPIVHGALLGGLISAILGTRLPGPGTIYLSQSASFRAPAYVGEQVTAGVQVEEINLPRRRVTLRTWVTGEDGRTILRGDAEVIA